MELKMMILKMIQKLMTIPSFRTRKNSNRKRKRQLLIIKVQSQALEVKPLEIVESRVLLARQQVKATVEH